MCDTMVALSNATKDGSVIFAKNSDRQPNEPLLTIREPRKKYALGEKLKCTYIEIEQVEQTYEVLLQKPSWMWGAEMGSNEFGLNIGNEAVFTREKQGPPSLLGMDMLRLALERCRSSEEALDLIIDLLKRYGQGGNSGYEKKFFYHNSFLIADPRSAWVLETAGSYWAAEQVKDVRSISNRLSIGSTYDRAHPDLIKNAVAKGWCKSDVDFNFARCYTNPLITRFSGSFQRSSSANCVLNAEKGNITMQTMRKILRSHQAEVEGQQFTRPSLSSVCMHAGFIFGDHTTGSYIARLVNSEESRPEDLPLAHTFLLTGSSTPCLALYKPFWMIEGENFSHGEDQAEGALLFWLKRERLHRAVLENKIPDLQAYLSSRNRIEAEIDRRLDSHSANQQQEIINDALQAEENLLEETMQSISSPDQPGRIRGNPFFKYYWKKQNAKLFKSER